MDKMLALSVKIKKNNNVSFTNDNFPLTNHKNILFYWSVYFAKQFQPTINIFATILT